MALLKPDPAFHATPGEAAAAPAEQLGCVVTLSTEADPSRPGMPNVGDELHHFGWNACSSALCPWAAHPHVERRYLLVPGLRSSRIHVIDVKADPHLPELEKVIDGEEIRRWTVPGPGS